MTLTQYIERIVQQLPTLSAKQQDFAITHFQEAADQAERIAHPPDTAEVQCFKPSGKYYTTDEWRIPEGAIGPYDMINSPDFRRIDGGPVLVPSQEPWGFPALLV